MPRDSPCPHYPRCVGCPLIGTAYGAQLDRKRDLVRAALAEYATLADVDVPDVVGSPRAFGYRNQAKLVARESPNGLLLGIYRPGTHDVVDIRRCPVHAPPINDVIARVAAVLERHRLSIYDERSGAGVLRYLIVRTSLWNRQVQVVLVASTRAVPRLGEIVRAIRRSRSVSSVVLNVNRDPGNVIFGPDFAALTKEDGLVEKIGGLRLRTRAGAFLQANPNVAGRIYRQVASWADLGSQEVAFDLFCGVGALTFHLAASARTVFGVESSPIAVVDAKRNARLNGIHNTRFHAGDAGAVLAELARELRPAVVCLNPPRKGATAELLAAIAASAPRRVIYVSCDPRTLARDLDVMAAQGYRVGAVRAYDMMPQTEHV